MLRPRGSRSFLTSLPPSGATQCASLFLTLLLHLFQAALREFFSNPGVAIEPLFITKRRGLRRGRKEWCPCCLSIDHGRRSFDIDPCRRLLKKRLFVNCRPPRGSAPQHECLRGDSPLGGVLKPSNCGGHSL